MMIVLAVGVTFAVLLLVLNLGSGEKKIKHEIAPLYAVEDPQFLRSMGSLLGPAIVGGNKISTLLNGDEIFPAMLEAIRSRAEDDHLRDVHLLVRSRSATSSRRPSPSGRGPA